VNELVELVARAIDEASDENSLAFMRFSEPEDPLVEKCMAADLEKRMRQARAAIEAMRRPTSEMLIAGMEAHAHYTDRQESTHLWQAMIDEALK
jgi:hypothetical protein